MFQIGFWELVVVAAVALWAFGPEKLPAFARIAGRFLSKAKQSYLNLKQEFDLEASRTHTQSSSHPTEQVKQSE